MKADINTIAERCGVSKATVSRVFTGKASVREPVRRQVLKVAHELNYAPQQSIHKDVIAIMTDDKGALRNCNSFQCELISLLIYEVVTRGYQVHLLEIKDINSLSVLFPKAAIVLSWNKKVTQKLSALKIPLITVNDRLEGCHAVCTDHAGGAFKAVEYLVQRGFKRIGLFVASLPGNWGHQERIRGYRKALEQNGLSYCPDLIVPIFEDSMVEALSIMLNQNPDALILGSEQYSLQLTYALNLLHKKVPDDISVISYENQPVSRWLTPPHTTIDQDLPRLSSATLDLIEEILDHNPDQLISKILPNQLIERRSVKNRVE